MNQEEKFKENLNKKLNEQSFEFNADNWAGAEALLDADKKGKRGIYYLIPLILLIGGFSAYLLMPLKSQENVLANNLNLQSLIYSNPDAVKKLTAIDVIENKSIQNQPLSAITLNKPNDVSESNSTEQNQRKNDEVIKPKQIEQITTNNLNQTTAITKPVVKIKPNASIKSTKIKEVKPVVEPMTPTVSQSTPSINIEPNKENKTDFEEGVKITANDNKHEDNPTTNNNNTETQANETKVTKEPITIESTPTTVSETKTLLVIEPKKAEVQVTANAIQKMEVLDSSKVVNNASADVITPTLVPNPTSFLFIEIGTAYNLGWQNPNKKDANGFNPLFGLFLNSMVYKQFSFSFGFQYSSIRNLKYSQHTSKITRYGLGEENTVTIITPSTLHYIYVPLKLNYSYKQNDVFSLGYNIGYLMNVFSKVETYNEHFNYTDNNKVYSTGGYTEGFAIFDSQVSMAYRRRIKKDFWFNTELYFGLSDIKDNTFFDLQKVERNKGIKISLMYNVFKK